MSEYRQNASDVLMAYLLEQRRLVRELSACDMDNPLTDLSYRHEADKLRLLETIAIEAGATIQITPIFTA